jgi:hypothetical protein
VFQLSSSDVAAELLIILIASVEDRVEVVWRYKSTLDGSDTDTQFNITVELIQKSMGASSSILVQIQ